MRYWFDEAKNELFQLAEPPPDGDGIIEVTEADFKAYEAFVRDEKAKLMQEQVENDHRLMADQASTIKPGVMVDMEKLARVWRKMQDARDELSHDFKIADLEIENQQNQVSVALLDAMNKMGGTSLKTAAGVIEKKPSLKASGADWDAIYKFVVANDAWELLHKRLGTQFIEKWMKTHDGAIPPGVNLFTEFKITVKKPDSKSLPTKEAS